MKLSHHMLDRPSHWLDEATDALSETAHWSARRPYSTAGIVAAIIAVLGFIWLFPELQRYIRIERM